jgi:flagellar basal-body rod modification protein FlgD
MATINPINTNTTQASTTTSKTSMNKEAFLKILVAQLQNQDPTQPMQDGEMISQMSQLSVLEQLSNLNQSLNAYLYSSQKDLSQYASMLDKKVTWTNLETNQSESGIVSGVFFKDNQLYVKIADQEVPASSILSVESNN